MSEATPSATPPVKRPAGRGRNLELPEHLKAYKGVWVFVEHDRGHVHSVSWELVGEARKLADKLGSAVSVVLLGGTEDPWKSTPLRPSATAPTKPTSCTTQCSWVTGTSPAPRR